MTKTEIKALSTLALFRHVFGKQEGQTLTQFASECETLKNDSAFVEEVRAYAEAQAVS